MKVAVDGEVSLLLYPWHYLTLSKADLTRVSKWRPQIDRLRKLRNDIVHNDLSDNAINEKEVLDGIYAAVALFEFIDSKVK